MPSRRRFLRGAAALAVAPAAFAAACSSDTTTPKTTPTVPVPPGGVSTATQPPASGSPVALGSLPGPETADPVLLASRWGGIKPFRAAPTPPSVKPINVDVADPPVITHVPTQEKIVFLTIDDGAEKDPAFVQMVKDVRIPFTMFLADIFIRNDPGYFQRLRETGYATIQNHTLTHPNMAVTSASRQREEVVGQQQKLIKEYGTTPYLFRPPFGNHNAGTSAAVKDAGLKGIVLWEEAFQKQDMQYQTSSHKLKPGDIILAHFRGPKATGKGWPEMHVLMQNLFLRIQEQGFTIAKLEDYV